MDISTNAAAQKALNKAKIQLMSSPDSAFFTTVCLSMKHIIDPKVPIACTNGINIRFNPDFLLKLTLPQQVFLLLHETMHCAYMHMHRGQGFDHEKFNRAADYVINAQLIERGFSMPKGGLFEKKYKNMSTEEVYKLLPDDPPPPPGGGGGHGDFGPDLESPDAGGGESSPAETKAAEEALSDIIVRAAIQSKVAGDKPGTIPGEIEIFINKLLDPKLPWYRILHKYMNQFNRNDFTFRKPNRRFFPDHYLPSLHSENLDEVAVAVDASGSVSDADFLQFISEVHTILKRFRPAKITLVQFDSRLKAVDEVRNVSELSRVKFSGRGGTQIEPVLEWARTNKPTVLLIFTDGYFHHHEAEAPKFPVVWLIHDNDGFAAPFGKVIHYQPHD